jgi:hypothetical protein
MDMKKLKIVLLIIALGALFTACRFGRRHTTIVENSNNNYMKIEYSGNIYFNHDGTAISSISPGGYVKYQHNDRKLEAKNNRNGGVTYELYDNGEKLSMNDEGKRFIAEAVQMMMKKGHTPPNGR